MSKYRYEGLCSVCVTGGWVLSTGSTTQTIDFEVLTYGLPWICDSGRDILVSATESVERTVGFQHVCFTAYDGKFDMQGNLEDLGYLVFTTARRACCPLPASMQPPGEHRTFSVYRYARAIACCAHPPTTLRQLLRSFALPSVIYHFLVTDLRSPCRVHLQPVRRLRHRRTKGQRLLVDFVRAWARCVVRPPDYSTR